MGIVVAFPASILLWLDYGRELREIRNPSRARRLLIFTGGVPQVLLGFVSLVSGVAIVVWVLYNSLWVELPEYSGGFLGFGVGPVLALFGLGLILDAFKKAPPSGGA